MAHFLRKDEAGNEVKGYDFSNDIELKVVGDKEIEIIGSTSVRDRDDEVIIAEGIDIKNFKKNPIVLPAHDYWQPAIGRAKNVKLEDGKLRFLIEFPDEGVNPVADIYRKLYKSGFMKASSIGFIPKEWSFGKGDNDPRRTYSKVELLEISLVSVPANPQALVTEKNIKEALSKGILSQDDIERAEQYNPTKAKRDQEEKGKTPVDKIPAWLKDVKDFEELMSKIRGDIREDIKSVILDLLKQGELTNPGSEHYSKVLFGSPERKTPQAEPDGKKTAQVLSAVKDTLEKELKL